MQQYLSINNELEVPPRRLLICGPSFSGKRMLFNQLRQAANTSSAEVNTRVPLRGAVSALQKPSFSHSPISARSGSKLQPRSGCSVHAHTLGGRLGEIAACCSRGAGIYFASFVAPYDLSDVCGTNWSEEHPGSAQQKGSASSSTDLISVAVEVFVADVFSALTTALSTINDLFYTVCIIVVDSASAAGHVGEIVTSWVTAINNRIRVLLGRVQNESTAKYMPENLPENVIPSVTEETLLERRRREWESGASVASAARSSKGGGDSSSEQEGTSLRFLDENQCLLPLVLLLNRSNAPLGLTDPSAVAAVVDHTRWVSLRQGAAFAASGTLTDEERPCALEFWKSLWSYLLYCCFPAPHSHDPSAAHSGSLVVDDPRSADDCSNKLSVFYRSVLSRPRGQWWFLLPRGVDSAADLPQEAISPTFVSVLLGSTFDNQSQRYSQSEKGEEVRVGLSGDVFTALMDEMAAQAVVDNSKVVDRSPGDKMMAGSSVADASSNEFEREEDEIWGDVI